MLGLNCGSGQRPFKSFPEEGIQWINVDLEERWDPDIVGNWNNLSQFGDSMCDYVVSHHSLEHVGCGEGDGFVREAWRVLKPGGSLLVFVPHMRELAIGWLDGKIDDQVYMTNIYGAYMGAEADRHRWGYTGQSLWTYLKHFDFQDVHAFNWRQIPGADIAQDWWILGMEAIK